MNERLAVLRNAAISSVGTYFEYFLGLIVSVWIARSLGPDEFGEYAFDIWLCGWMIVACNHALSMSSIRFIAEARGTGDDRIAAGISGLMLRIQGISSIIVVAAFVPLALIFAPDDWRESLLTVVILIVIAVVAKAGFVMRVSIAKGYELFAPEAIAAVSSGVVSVALVYVWSSAGGGALGYLAIFATLSLLMNVIIRVSLRRRGIQPRTVVLAAPLRERIHRHLMLTGSLVVLYSLTGRTIETFLLKATGSSEELGYFAISATLTKGAVDFLSSGLSATLLPAMARVHGRGSNTLLSVMLPDTIRFFWFLGLAIAGLGYAVTPSLVALLFGSKYLAAIPAVQVSLVVAGSTLLIAPINAYQTIADQQADRIRITVGSLFINAVAAVLLVPRLGLTGALTTLALSRVGNAAIAMAFVRIRTGLQFPVLLMMRMLLAAAVACAAGLAVNSLVRSTWEFLVSGLMFVVVYLAASIVFRCWKAGDFALAASVVRKLPGVGGSGAFLNYLIRNFSCRD